MAIVNPIDYSGGSGFLQGLKAYGGMQEIQQARMANEQAAAQQEALNAFKSDWQASFGDPQKMSALVAKYPGQMDAIKAGIGFQDEQHQMSLGNAARDLRVAMATGNPQAVQLAAVKHAGVLNSVGSSADDITQQFQQDPNGLANIVDAVGLSALGAKDYYGITGERDKLAETVRSNKAGEGLQARGQNITMRGQDISSATARRGQDMASQRAGAAGGQGDRVVQLADGRTVNVGGKLHGAGANAFYEGIDNAGNMVRVPASSIAAPATSAASAQNYAMKKDLDAISGASADDLGFMTGVTGSSGSPALGADIRSRASGGDQRKLYNAAQRVQGKMQNQGIAAARDMGASGINTVAEAKMYFQGMPQVDYSSPEAMQQSMRDIQQYTDNYNQQYQVDVGNGGNRQQSAQPSVQQTTQPKTSGYQSLWGD
ncbi:phage DNA ejection protein [Citrobacter freundii]|uniref:Phage DNA ejection protein n=1 Tax=Citrobacter freundii TaxID=546 RepID=A0AAN4JFG2_CITFR|nr:phage DNA ejection protein [Citrobacter freundii]